MIYRNMNDPETRVFWETVIKRVEAFNKRAPTWLKDEQACPGCGQSMPTWRWRCKKCLGEG